ncbi:MAG: quinoprotein relay system zinc metallohydrolase 2 [Hyphomicrobiaceae bacterium]
MRRTRTVPLFDTVLDRRSCLRALTGLGALLTGAWFDAQRAKATPAGETGKAVEVAPGVFVLRGVHGVYAPANHGDISNRGFIVGRDAVAVVDTGGTARLGAKQLATVRAITDRPVRFVINTHMHPDHVLGNVAFRSQGVEFVGHAKLAAALAARAERYLSYNRQAVGEEEFSGTEVVLPTRGIDVPTKLDLGDRTLLLSPQRTAHTDNDLTVLDESTGSLFVGDLVFSGHVPTLDGSIRGWIKLLEALSSAAEAQRIVPGHGPKSMSWQEAAPPMLRYLGAVASDVRAAIAAGRTMSATITTAAQGERSQWELFDEFHGRNVSAAFAELEWE